MLENIIIYCLSTNDMTDDICNCCCLNFTTTTRKPVVCIGCEYTACRNCVKKYLLNLHDFPRCMNNDCKMQWNRKFQVDNLTQSWVNGPLKDNISNILFDIELTLLGQTQEVLEQMKLRQNKRELIKNLNKKILERIIQIRNLNSSSEIVKLRQEILEIEGEKKIIKSSTEKPRFLRKFIKGCPNKNCRSFLNEDYKCTQCNCVVCKDCNEIINYPNHECIKENVESTKLLKHECRPCPTCASEIYKINGCDHMFCTQCKSSFSWKTGKMIVNNTNPHYYNWLRTRNDTIETHVCGDRVNQMSLHYHMKNIDLKNSLYKSVMMYHLLYNHILNLEIPVFTHDNYDNDNQDLRIKYLTYKIDKDRFKQILHFRKKKKEKYLEYLQIFQMYTDVINDLFVKIISEKDHNNINLIDTEMDALTKFMFDNLSNISSLYDSKIDFYHLEELII